MSAFIRQPCEEGPALAAGDCAPCSRTRERYTLAAAILGSSMAFIDGTVANLLLPALQSSLDASVSQIQWVVEAYALFLAALLLTGGTLGDRFGRRRVFSLGVALFAAASAVCGLAGSPEVLIAARAVQGAAAALLVPGSLALISTTFPRERRAGAIGIWSGFSAIMSGLGLVLGGLLIELASWRWAFWINVPIAIVTLLIVSRHVRESRDPDAAGIDWAGTALSIMGLGGLTYGLIEAGPGELTDPRVLAGFALGGFGLGGFLAAEQRVPHPIMPLGLFHSRPFSGANLLTFFLYAALGAIFFFLPLNLVQVQGLSEALAGAALTPIIAVMFLFSGASGRLVERVGARTPLIAGPLISAAGFGLLALPGTAASYWWGFLPALLVLGTGLVLSVAPLTNTVMSAVDDTHAGLASGVNNAVSRAAGLIAIAAFGPVVLWVFSYSLEAQLAAQGLQSVWRSLAPQTGQLAALSPSQSLPLQAQLAVDAAVDAAFVTAFRVVAVTCAVLAAAAALTAAAAIREVEDTGRQARRRTT